MGNTQSNLPTYYNADPNNESYTNVLSDYVDLASAAIGAKVVKASNERFGAAKNLLKPSHPEKGSGKDRAADAEMDAWVTRRHNPEADWAVIRLGSTGTIAGFDIDTRGLDGEHAAQVSIQGCLAPVGTRIDSNGELSGQEWQELLPVVETAANSRHLLALWTQTKDEFNHVRISLHPDGGVSRLRIYGTVTKPQEEETASGEIDLALVNSGARVILASDEKLGAKSNLILPGRATLDSPETQGWKTRRTQAADHSDWAIVRLGEPGFLTRIELDTRTYDGDQPVSAAVQACYTDMVNPERDSECFWYQIVPRTELNANRLHRIDVTLNDVPFSHIRLVTYPDGGISRIRAFGQRVKEIEKEAAREEAEAAAEAAVAVEAGLDAATPEASTDAEEAAESVKVVVTEAAAEVTKTKKADKHVRSSPRKKASKPSKHSAAAEPSTPENFSSRSGELLQGLTSPVAPKKRGRPRSRADDDTDDGSINTVDSGAKRSRRKAKSRNAA
ncbi:Allantoicase [Coemansia sp. RSA 1813]|nr:Allantoicase [Coemansia sp. RSA 1646]KAJ1773460.1 Allantoicase [Coemansia sp. RSA 1843]KAJ2091285.1 Allantoicase [Coemansia sp. RSA 986]KAJ2216476.1 Allantoicase [Coemansia sp. RSA 487]KAJ2571441.1 Allantoicase [Coemansia sp. RSA 1813]